MKDWLTWVPAILIMILIFIYSSKPADISGQESMAVTDYIYTVYENISGQTESTEERIENVSSLETVVRKGAHFTEYAMLAAAIAWPLRRRGLLGYSLLFATMGLTVFYVMTDEFHQTFVPGRSGEIRDVLIDSVGALTGYIIFIIIYQKVKKAISG